MRTSKRVGLGLLLCCCVWLGSVGCSDTVAQIEEDVADVAQDQSRPRPDFAIDPLDPDRPMDLISDTEDEQPPGDTTEEPSPDLHEPDVVDLAEDQTIEPETEEEVSDRDEDGVRDEWDAFPDDPNEAYDNDGDGTGDNADLDDDNDGLSDEEELSVGEDCVISSPYDEDGDGDGILDVDDPYPLDPFPEFILNANDLGSFYFFLSNRDGTFGEREEWGDDIGDNYRGFAVADFDADGRMDFITHNDTPDDDGLYDMWFFYRTSKEDEFVQINLGKTEMRLGGVVADINGDNRFDVVLNRAERAANNKLLSFTGWSFTNNGDIRSAACAVADYPDTSCAFTRRQAYYFGEGSVIYDQWSYSFGRQAMNIAGTDDKDLVFSVFPHGGVCPSTLYRLEGAGDGTFSSTPVEALVHNHAAVISLVFADFTSDEIGDVIVGLDDDGDAGQAWLYRGTGTGVFETTSHACFDLEPGIESGQDNIGVTSTARTFDFDFDGNMDIMVSHNNGTSPWNDGPSIIEILMGNGDGTFEEPVQVGPTVPTGLGNSFEIPTRLCPWYE